MEKTKILVLIVLSILLLITSCKKESKNESMNNSSIYLLLDESIPIIKNPYPINSHINEQKDEPSIDFQLLEIGLLARQLFEDNIYNELLISEAKKNETHCVDIRLFLNLIKK